MTVYEENLAYKLKTIFKVRVPRRATYSYAELEVVGLVQKFDKYGQPVTKKTISDTEEDLCESMLPLSRLLELYSNGTYIALINQDDIMKIYHILNEYISYYTHTDDRYSLNKIELKDNYVLEQVEKFLNEVYENNPVSVNRGILKNSNLFNLGFGLIKSEPIPSTGGQSQNYFQIDNMPSPDTSNKSWRD